MEHEKILLDFETRSRVNLRTVGLARYVHDPTTVPMSAAYKTIGGSEITLWKPGEPIRDFSNSIIFAWNAQFEKAFWEHVLHWPNPAGWYDIAAHARFVGLPGALKNACTWLGLTDKLAKDLEGHKAMMRLTNPIKTGKRKGEFDNDPKLFDIMYEYNKQDLVAEEAILEVMPPWPESEQKIWAMTVAQNERGCPIDVPLCEAVVSLTEQFLDRARTTMQEETKGAIVSPQQTVALVKWLNEQGINIADVQKGTISKLLLEKNLTPSIRKVLLARQIGAPASVKKFRTALEKQVNNRLFHNFFYCGAGATGRWSGTSEDSSSVQLQNLFRGEQTEWMLATIKMADADILSAVSETPIRELQNSTRSMLAAADKKIFLYTDLSAIEARVLRWLAKSPALNDFRIYDAGGPDPYKAEAAKTFGKPLDKVSSDDRQCGKVLVLSAQYGVGWEKFKATVSSWTGGKVVITDSFAQLTIKKFRAANPAVTKFWRDLENAFKDVLVGKRETVKVGVLEFSAPYKATVAIKLPSGRSMYYNRCKVVGKEVHYTKHDGTLVRSYGAHFAENVTQAVSRDIMAEGMLGCDIAGLPVVHHAHDSLLIELDEATVDAKIPVLSTIMTTPPVWAKGLPLASPIKKVRRMP